MTTEQTADEMRTGASASGTYADVNGISLYHERHGAGRPMLLLHGGLGSGEMFEPILPLLSEGHEVIAVDLQGHGRTADIDRPIDVRHLADDIAALVRTKAELGLEGGVLVANPVPQEHEIPAAEIAGYIETALAEASKRGIAGKAVTPFLLSHMFEITGGRSLATNIALVRNNAALAAQIAVALSVKKR